MASIFDRLAYQATSAATSKATTALTNKLGLSSSNALKYTSTARALLNGDMSTAANKLMDTIFGRTSKYAAGGNVILAGQAWSTIQSMYEEAAGIERERANLFHVGVEPVGAVVAPRVNLLCIEASYNGVQLGWDTVKIGSGFTQRSAGAEPVELRLTTYDVDGEIKAWFDQLKYLVAPPDGTYGLPSDYCNTFTLTHGTVEEGTGYSASWVMVPVSCEVNSSRSTDEFTALNLTFSQFDYFGSL